MADEIEIDDADLQPIEGEEAPVERQSLDDVISNALDSAEEPADPKSEAQPSDRTRDEKGRFAAKTDSEAAPAPEAGTSEPSQVPSTEQPPPNAQPDVSEGHFRGWTPEQRTAFNALPPEAQKTVLDVVKGRDQFYTEKLSDYDQAFKAVSPLVNAVKPHLSRIEQVTNDPSRYVQHVLDIDYRLQFAPYAEKVQLLSELAKNVGVSISIPQPDAFSDPTGLNGEAYPVIHDLRNQITQLTAQVQGFQRHSESAQQQHTASLVRSFTSQTNPDGSPKYPLFEQVKSTMGQLLDGNKAATMEEAYALAVKPIEDAIAQRVAAQTRATQAASQAALEKAKRAQPVKKTGMTPGGTTKGGGIDAIISGALDQAGFN